MNQTEQDKQNQQNCKKCDRIVGCDYRGRKHKCDCQIESDDPCESCKKLGENTCGNDIHARCYEPIN